MPARHFQKGDLVKLKSGGPIMTVNAMPDGLHGYECQWFAGKKLEFGYFEAESLVEAEEE